MFSIQKILGGDQKFYDLWGERRAGRQRRPSLVHCWKNCNKMRRRSIWRVCTQPSPRKTHHAGLNRQISKTLLRRWSARHSELAAALYKIPKTVEKIGDAFICRKFAWTQFSEQVELLDQAAETVLAMVKQLRRTIPVGTRDECELRRSAKADSWSWMAAESFQRYHPKQIVFLHDLYGLLENNRPVAGRRKHHPAKSP